jgi:hypothetical protein
VGPSEDGVLIIIHHHHYHLQASKAAKLSSFSMAAMVLDAVLLKAL